MSEHNTERGLPGVGSGSCPIAIVGMASIFPQAHNLAEYWDIILNKTDCITEVPSSHWNILDYYDPDPSTPDKTYCKHGGFIPDIDFDPVEFGLPPNILEATDVSQLLALLVARDALADAGYAQAAEVIRERTGVILGVVVGQQNMRPLLHRLQYPIWQKVLKNIGLSDEDTARAIEKMGAAYTRWEENSFPGFLSNVIAGRIANRLDLGGVNCVVDAACASSLSAVKMAVNELATYQTDMMITGGVDIDNSILTYMCFSKTPAFSRQENVRPFDAASDGMMAGEGVGMLVLKRLADAERDGDRIYAVIKGIGAASDGRFKSIYAPRPEGQARALRRAYAAAGFDPQTVSLLEAHGTGTVAGDLCEVTALSQVFERRGKRPHIALGSVKSQIGHTKAAAGAASLIKTSLALYHKVLPPTINVTTPNPKFKLEETALYLNTAARPWLPPDPNTPRRAGVSSFGFGGTDYHVVLEEYAPESGQAYRLNKVAQSILLAAPTTIDLLANCESLLQKLKGSDAHVYYNELVETSKTLEVPANFARLGFVADSREMASELLQLAITQLKTSQQAAWEHPKGIYYRQQAANPGGKVVALFAGQGSQYLEMGRELAQNFPPLREAYLALDKLFLTENDPTLSSVVYPAPTFDRQEQESNNLSLQNTKYAQPAIGAISAGLYRLMKQAGFQPDFVAGHSFGELTALWAAGVINDTDYFGLVKARGAAMAAPVADPAFDAGAMLAVARPLTDLQTILAEFPEVTVANHNAPSQVVLAGTRSVIAALQTALKTRNISATALPVSAAFHTPLVAHAQQPFGEAIRAASFHSPAISVFSNTTGQSYPQEPAAIRQLLGEHLLKPVLFQEEIENIYAQGGYFFVEVGPRDILTNLVKNILGDKPFVAVALNASRQKDSDRQLRSAVIQLRVAGLTLRDIDPYQQRPAAPTPRAYSQLRVRLNGAPYVSEATRKAFDKALNDGYKVKNSMSDATNPAKTEASRPPETTSFEVTPVEQPALAPVTRMATEQTVIQAPANYAQASERLEYGLAHFSSYQSGVLQAHEQYLNNQAEYTSGFFQLMQQQQSLLLNQPAAPAPGVLESLERNMNRFHDYQSETLRVHDRYLQQQADYSHNLFNLLEQQAPTVSAPSGENYRPLPRPAAPLPATRPSNPVRAQSVAVPVAVEPAKPIPTPVVETAKPIPAVVEELPAPAQATVVSPPVSVPSVQAAPVVATNQLATTLLQVVSEKTGYPTDMLELEMDMEADLGIDSIKRVEILGAMQEHYPELPRLSADELAEMRTLGQIIGYMEAQLGGPVETPPSALVEDSSPAIATAVTTPVIATDTIATSLLEVVSEKTGYPTDMLELGMDMEADLGIDSIKRVEILGAMQEKHPLLARPNSDDLAELRTLQQIIEYLSGSAPSAPATAIPSEVEETGPVEQELSSGVVRLKRLPEPDYLEVAPPQNHVCLITDDGSDTPSQLAEALTSEGWRVAVLNFPSTPVVSSAPLPPQVERIKLENLSEKGLEQLLKEVVKKLGPVGGFIHLNQPIHLPNPGNLSLDEAQKQVLKQVFLVAKHLKKSLTEAAAKGRACFMTVARLDGELGLGNKLDFNAISGGLFGLTKTLKQEWDQVYCRALDLAPELDPESIVHYILAELHDPNRLLSEVAYNAQGERLTLISEPVAAGESHHA